MWEDGPRSRSLDINRPETQRGKKRKWKAREERWTTTKQQAKRFFIWAIYWHHPQPPSLPLNSSPQSAPCSSIYPPWFSFVSHGSDAPVIAIDKSNPLTNLAEQDYRCETQLDVEGQRLWVQELGGCNAASAPLCLSSESTASSVWACLVSDSPRWFDGLLYGTEVYQRAYGQRPIKGNDDVGVDDRWWILRDDPFRSFRLFYLPPLVHVNLLPSRGSTCILALACQSVKQIDRTTRVTSRTPIGNLRLIP